MHILSGLRTTWERRRVARLPLAHKGANVQIEGSFDIVAPEQLWMGNHAYIGPHRSISALGGVRIGSGTIIGPRVTVFSANHRYEGANAVPYDDVVIPLPVTIGENVWIGGNVTIVPGVTLGEGCVVGAGAVIASNFEPYCIVCGNPARVIKMRDVAHYTSLKHQGKVYLQLKTAGLMSPHRIE